MASYNKIILIGHLGDDPVVRDYEGRKVANFSLAVNAYTRPGEEPKTDWFRISFWGNNAEVVEKYLKKGKQVYVEGRLSTRTYTDNTGQTRFSLDVQGQNMTMLGSREEGGMNQGQGGSYAAPPQTNAKRETTETSFSAEEPDDLPF
ncbi:MAG TPA: single-stranded DNA-binding protein [Microscillaceae bacterium]|nr:single-stranded DNA-binding protein [Microscillaceae bacterium]